MPGDPEIVCPHCGESFKPRRLSCPHCGSDAETGWLPIEEQASASVDLSFTHLEEADYEHFVKSEKLLAPDAATGRIPRLLVVLLIGAALIFLLAIQLWGSTS